ncbi:hypothetical protein QN277_023581 [Acacia crassicarpa]|uniref:Uncharacterized protein n=1 Tax=Acacia crassicarpa TaxID=499986 RepID=A0AAE1KBI7_9FABA|nr:hypothetical protein QN277_023581 [Acacia crassicarpa]
MASNGHTNTSGSSNPDYEMLEHIMKDIKHEPQDLNTRWWSIYRVPFNLRNLKKDAYTPQLVSIGPLHYGLKKLNRMQTQKLRYFNFFRDRVEKNVKDMDNIKNMDNFKKYLECKQDVIRQCYAEKLRVDINKEKLVDIMLLDSVFIMELFLRIQNVEKDPDDIIMKQPWLNKSIQRDMLLLENQIPLFVLEELYGTFVSNSREKHATSTFIELARGYFDCYQIYHTYGKCDEEKKSSPGCVQINVNCCTSEKGDSTSREKTGCSDPKGGSPKHFTDLIRFFYICKNLNDFKEGPPLRATTKLRELGVSSEKVKNKPLRTATKLMESGVSFEKVNNKPLLDIKFQKHRILSNFLCLGCFPKSSCLKARLQIPQLKVEDTTECVLRNLIAFEQCHYPDQPYICNYVSFIDSLIHTKDDVELLVEKEVIVHELGSDKEVATLVNGLCKHVVTDKTCYRGIIDDLNQHYQSQWNRTMAALRLVYFRDAWRASSTLVATAVLVFTIFNFCRVVRLVLDLEGGNKKH